MTAYENGDTREIVTATDLAAVRIDHQTGEFTDWY